MAEPSVKLSHSERKNRRVAIKYLLQKDHSTASAENLPQITFDISTRLGITSGNKRVIKRVYDAISDNPLYDGTIQSGRGRKRIIQDHSPESKIALSAMGSGLPVSQATVLVNLYRKSANLDIVAPSTVEAYSNASPLVKKFRRCSKKKWQS